MAKEKLERICFNCNQFFLISYSKPTEFGICISDQVFDPFIDELLKDPDSAPCQDLINLKKFTGEKEPCDEFEELEEVEIDDNSPLGLELSRLGKTGNLDFETYKEVILEEKIRNIDWKTVPVEKYATQLKNSDPGEQKVAISNLCGLIVLGNNKAFKELSIYFKQLLPPKTIEEVHSRKELLRHLKLAKNRELLIPQLIDELYRTPSNNTTRQWISDIFQFLGDSPLEKIRAPLEKMLKDKRFSYRLKKKIKNILNSTH
ncbi:MAG: hypothetical protein HOD92_14885 [Deltaproteobacteria bacterium]|nr:hypothetical protein [Deltaproteobacteria bacterium]MBT4526504.1 hypothetical protein [Deltaproteobacteria bacterium]